VDDDHIRVNEIEMALEGEQFEPVYQTEITMDNMQQHFTHLEDLIHSPVKKV